MGRPTPPLVLTDAELEELRRLTKRATVNRLLAFRARLMLACAEPLPSTVVATRHRTTTPRSGNGGSDSCAIGWRALDDEPRVGAPCTVTDEQVEAIIVKTLQATPPGETHWSTRSMAKAAGVSHTRVGRIWRTLRLQSHRTETHRGPRLAYRAPRLRPLDTGTRQAARRPLPRAQWRSRSPPASPSGQHLAQPRIAALLERPATGTAAGAGTRGRPRPRPREASPPWQSAHGALGHLAQLRERRGVIGRRTDGAHDRRDGLAGAWGTVARRLRMKCTRQRCHVLPLNTC